MFKEKNAQFKNLFFIVVVGLLILIVLYFVFAGLSRNKKAVTQPNTKEMSEEEIIKEINKDVIEKANQEKISEVESAKSEDHIWGKPEAPVEMIVYSDFECPFCADFADTVKKIQEEFSGKVMIVYRHFPLELHSQAIPAALAAECAAEQGKFWEMHDKLFEDSREGFMNQEVFKEDAQEVGLNTVKFSQCLKIEKYKDKISDQIAEGKEAGVTGTPTIFVNGEIFPGAYPWEDFTRRDGRKEEGMRSIILRHLSSLEGDALKNNK